MVRMRPTNNFALIIRDLDPAEKGSAIANLLLGCNSDFDCVATLIDVSRVLYSTECEDGWDDHDVPVVGYWIWWTDEDPICEFSINELAAATVTTNPLTIKVGKYSLNPLSTMTGE